MAVSERLSDRQKKAVQEHLKEKRAAQFETSTDVAEAIGAGLRGERLEKETDTETRLRIAELMEKLDRNDALRGVEKSRYTREVKRSDAEVLKALVNLATGLAGPMSQMQVTKMNNAQSMYDGAMDMFNTKGWSAQEDEGAISSVNDLAGHFQADPISARDGKFGWKLDETKRNEFYQAAFEQITTQPDAMQNALFIEAMNQEYGLNLYAFPKDTLTAKGASKAIGPALVAAQDAMNAAKGIEKKAEAEIEQSTNTMLAVSGVADPRLRTQIDNQVALLRKPVDLSRRVSVSAPVGDNATYAQKKAWVEAFTKGTMTLDPDGQTVAPTMENSDPSQVPSTTYDELAASSSRGAPIPETTTRDYAEDLWEQAGSDSATGRAIKQHFINDSQEYRQYKAMRGYKPPGSPDDDVAYKAFIQESRAERGADRISGKELARQNILSGEQRSTAGQYRRAALASALLGPSDGQTIGRDPVGAVGKALLAPVALPAALLAGGAKSLRDFMKRRKQQEPTESEPEVVDAPGGDDVASEMTRLREAFDAGEITADQFELAEKSFSPAPAGRTIEFSEGNYKWRVTLDENDKPVGEAKILEGSPAAEVGKSLEIAGKFGSIITEQVEEAIANNTATVVRGTPFGEEAVGEEAVDPDTGFYEEPKYEEWKIDTGEEEREIAEPVEEPGSADPGWVAPSDPAQKEAEAEAQGLDLEPEGKVRVDPIQKELREKQVKALANEALKQGIISADTYTRMIERVPGDGAISVLGEGNSLEAALLKLATPEQQQALQSVLAEAQELQGAMQVEAAQKRKEYVPGAREAPKPAEEEEEFEEYAERLGETAGSTGEKLISEIKAQKKREAVLRALTRPEGIEEMSEKEYGAQKKAVKKTTRQVKKGTKKVERLESKAKKKAVKKTEKERDKRQGAFYAER